MDRLSDHVTQRPSTTTALCLLKISQPSNQEAARHIIQPSSSRFENEVEIRWRDAILKW